MADSDILNTLVKEWLQQRNLQHQTLFRNINSENEIDLKTTFFQFLISRCIIRYAVNPDSYGIYKFSEPGKKIMEDENKRLAFISEFLVFYNQ